MIILNQENKKKERIDFYDTCCMLLDNDKQYIYSFITYIPHI